LAVHHFAVAKGRRAKTDAIDAALIAEFTAAFPESPPAVRDLARVQLAGLIRARRLVVTRQADLVSSPLINRTGTESMHVGVVQFET
jgi:transposase